MANTQDSQPLRVKCFECGHKDGIRSDYYRPKGGEFWCDECGVEREYEPDLSPNDPDDRAANSKP